MSSGGSRLVHRANEPRPRCLWCFAGSPEATKQRTRVPVIRNFSLPFVRPFSTATREMNRGFWAGLRSRRSRLSSAIRLCGCPCGGGCGGPPTTKETKFPHFMAMCAGKGSS